MSEQRIDEYLRDERCKKDREIEARKVAEFQRESDALLALLPVEFRGFVYSYAYDRSHAYGYQEVLDTTSELVDLLLPAIKAYATARGERKP